MSRTTHHRRQNRRHWGHDYGGRYKCNKGYVNGYGVNGRDKADAERRGEDRKQIQNGIKDCPTNGIE